MGFEKNVVLYLRFEIDALFKMNCEIERRWRFPEIRGKDIFRFEIEVSYNTPTLYPRGGGGWGGGEEEEEEVDSACKTKLQMD